jgi:hypothetical protein
MLDRSLTLRRDGIATFAMIRHAVLDPPKNLPAFSQVCQAKRLRGKKRPVGYIL